jgi:hypothetical protein
MIHIKEPGDRTSRRVVPDFEGAKYHHWQHMKKAAEKAGTLDSLPRKPRSGLAETSFFSQVDRHTSRVSFGVGVAFDANGRIIREDN